jgi:uncharacterized protein DUF4352
MLGSLRGGTYRVRLLLTLAIVCVVALVIIACGAASDTASNSGTTTNGGTSSATKSQHFKVGQQVKVGDTYVVTVNSVKTDAGDDVFKPKDGNTFLIVDVSLKNVSSKEQDLSSLLQFTLKDSSGQKYDETIVSNATAPDGKIEAGDVTKGQLAYEVPAAQKSFTLAFEADIVSGGQTTWDLSV